MMLAVWVDCPGVTNDGRGAHMMRDACYSCAPFWEHIPLCPGCRRPLRKYGRTKCRTCKVYVMVGSEAADRV